MLPLLALKARLFGKCDCDKSKVKLVPVDEVFDVLFMSLTDAGPAIRRAAINDDIITVIKSCLSLVVKSSLKQASATAGMVKGTDDVRDVTIGKGSKIERKLRKPLGQKRGQQATKHR